MNVWVNDENGNRASSEYWGSVELAKASLKKLVNCYGCENCSFCKQCYGCVNCNHCTDCNRCTDCNGIELQESANLNKTTTALEIAKKEFDDAWRLFHEAGLCDASGCKEFFEIRKKWLENGAAEFIKIHVNITDHMLKWVGLKLDKKDIKEQDIFDFKK